MYFPTLRMPFSSVTDYSQQGYFDKLVFQFSIIQVYNTEVVTLICYAMNTSGRNMHDDPIIMEYDSNGDEMSFPINFGNLELSGGELGQLDLQLPNIPAIDKILVFEPRKDDLNYVCYDLSVDVNKIRLLSFDSLNPCPPRCNERERPQLVQ